MANVPRSMSASTGLRVVAEAAVPRFGILRACRQ